MMYAIRNKRTKKWLYGTDYRYHPHHQRTSESRMKVYESYEEAKTDFICRDCGKEYEIVPVIVKEKEE